MSKKAFAAGMGIGVALLAGGYQIVKPPEPKWIDAPEPSEPADVKLQVRMREIEAENLQLHKVKDENARLKQELQALKAKFQPAPPEDSKILKDALKVTCDDGSPEPKPDRWGWEKQEEGFFSSRYRIYEVTFPGSCAYSSLEIHCTNIVPPITPPPIYRTRDGFAIIIEEKNGCSVFSSTYNSDFRRPTGPIVSNPKSSDRR